MAATYSREEFLVIETDVEIPAIDEDLEFEDAFVLPWYRRVPAPGRTTSRHWKGHFPY